VSSGGPVVIRLGARHIGGVWEFAVSDNGIGIETE
jgi:signal transduction histidine kinase